MFDSLDKTELLKALNTPTHVADEVPMGWDWLTTGSRSIAQDPAAIYEKRERRARLTARLYGGTKQDHINAQYRY